MIFSHNGTFSGTFREKLQTNFWSTNGLSPHSLFGSPFSPILPILLKGARSVHNGKKGIPIFSSKYKNKEVIRFCIFSVLFDNAGSRTNQNDKIFSLQRTEHNEFKLFVYLPRFMLKKRFLNCFLCYCTVGNKSLMIFLKKY